MGTKRYIQRGQKRSGKFNVAGGKHSWKYKKQIKEAYKRGEFLENQYKNFKGPPYQLKSIKACFSGKPRIKFVVRRIPITLKRLKFVRSQKKETTGKFLEMNDPLDGARIMNLDLLKKHIATISSHTALCEKARDVVLQGKAPVVLHSEERHGLATILKAKCVGCGEAFHLNNTESIETGGGKYFDINVRGVWGSMVTGGGCSSLNECLGTMGVPTVNEVQYTKTETMIGNWWRDALEEEMLKAGEEEKALAIDNNEFHEGVPAITVVCDGGWSKRSHKHTYNAMGGVAVIFGHKTKKLLHIGVRNRLCYICSQAQTKNVEPRQHDCYKNWNESAQSMESDIIVEGFLCAESKHGVRYMHLIGDGDSSVLQDIMEKVPVWGKHVKKLECANHACKCLRTHLETLVSDHPTYKGKGKLSKINRIRIVTAVRCAIKMRSKEANRQQAIHKLKKDIKNAGRHVLGLHDLCSTDFCKHKIKDDTETVESDEKDENENDDEDVFCCNESFWKDSVCEISELEEKSLRKGGKTNNSIDEQMLKDLFFYLNRLSEKSDRLIGNFTSNLAESWMHIRCKFDGGKTNNKCFRASFYARCYGGALRSSKGPGWSPMVYQNVTGKRPDSVYINTYRLRSKKHVQNLKAAANPKNKDRKRKRKMETNKKCNDKKAKLKYGKGILDDRDDISAEELSCQMDDYYEKNVKVTPEEIEKIEKQTKDQSLNAHWFDERKKRLTSSVFGEVVSRGVNNNTTTLTDRLLYTKFMGNKYTRKGLTEENVTIEEYKNYMTSKGQKCETTKCGFKISKSHPFLGASADGLVAFEDGTKGLLEVKNLLQNEKMLIKQAAFEKKTFCLTVNKKNEIELKRNHKFYFQIQGQLNINEMEFCDFVVRRTNPYDFYVERIKRDSVLWTTKIVPKLSAFYFTHLLPELASPRKGTVSGIRKAPVPWYQDQKLTPDNIVSHPATRKVGYQKKKTGLNTSKLATQVVEPDIQGVKAATHVDKGATLVNKPVTQVSKIATQVSEPATHVGKSATQVDKPLTHTDTPETQISQPTTYINKPVAQISKPGSQISTPETQISKPVPQLCKTATQVIGTEKDRTCGTFHRSRRRTKVKFVGRRITHLWKEGVCDKDTKWYTGSVLSVIRGNDGDPDALYEVQYDDDDVIYEIDNLAGDLQNSQLRFIDI